MCGDDPERALLVESLQDGFGYGTPDLRFRTSTELVNEDEASFVAALHHVLHVGEVR